MIHLRMYWLLILNFDLLQTGFLLFWTDKIIRISPDCSSESPRNFFILFKLIFTFFQIKLYKLREVSSQGGGGVRPIACWHTPPKLCEQILNCPVIYQSKNFLTYFLQFRGLYTKQ